MMKRRLINWFTVLAILILCSTGSVFAQNPPHPGEDPTTGGEIPVGGGASLSGGLTLMFLMGALYGGKKTYDLHKKRGK